MAMPSLAVYVLLTVFDEAELVARLADESLASRSLGRLQDTLDARSRQLELVRQVHAHQLLVLLRFAAAQSNDDALRVVVVVVIAACRRRHRAADAAVVAAGGHHHQTRHRAAAAAAAAGDARHALIGRRARRAVEARSTRRWRHHRCSCR